MGDHSRSVNPALRHHINGKFEISFLISDGPAQSNLFRQGNQRDNGIGMIADANGHDCTEFRRTLNTLLQQAWRTDAFKLKLGFMAGEVEKLGSDIVVRINKIRKRFGSRAEVNICCRRQGRQVNDFGVAKTGQRTKDERGRVPKFMDLPHHFNKCTMALWVIE